MNWKGIYAFSVIRSQSAGFRIQERLAMEQKAIMKTEAGHRWLWLLLIVIVAVALAVVMIPAALIMPFRRQTPFGVELSWLLRRWSPVVTIAALIAALAVVVSLWRRSKGFVKRAAMIVLVLPLIAAAWFARQNHFEWMFQPLPNAAYARAGEANFVADNDLVMGIEINGEAVAYPVRQMAYHHVVNDVVGGRPITATY